MTRKARSGPPKKAKKKFTIEMTPLSAGLWGFCLFFLLAWIFVLGILVGRGFLPGGVTTLSDLKDQLSKVQTLVGRNQSRERRSEKKSEADPKLVFYERLSSKKGEAKQESPSQENPDRTGVAEKTRQEKRPTAVRQRETSSKEAGSPGMMEREKGDNTGVSKKPAGPSFPEMRYTVQLASMAEKGKAEEMINGLIKRGYPAYHYEVKVDGRIYYRVRCGRFATRAKAEEFSKTLTKKAGVKGFVTSLE